MSTLELGSAFLLGLMGAPHCITMCGPIAAMSCGSAVPTAGSQDKYEVAGRIARVQAGRLLGYATLGALAAGLFGFVERATFASEFHFGAKIFCGVTLLLVGIASSGLLPKAIPGSSGVRSLVSRVAAKLLGKAGFGRTTTGSKGLLARGLLWGFLPCGLIYGALALAMSTGNALLGASVMAAFFVGTLPAIVGVLSLLRGAAEVFRHSTVRLAAGLLMALGGALQLQAAVVNGIAPHAVQSTGEQAEPAEAPRPCCHAAPPPAQ